MPTPQEVITFVRNRSDPELFALARFLGYEEVRRRHVPDTTAIDTAIGYIAELSNPQALALQKMIMAEVARRTGAAKSDAADVDFLNT